MTTLEDFEMEFKRAGWDNLGQVVVYLSQNPSLLDNVPEAAKKLRVHPDIWAAIRQSATFRPLMAEALLIQKHGYNGYLALVEAMYKRAVDENAKDAVAAAKFVVNLMRMARPQEITVNENKTFRIQRAPDVELPQIGAMQPREAKAN